MYFDQDCLSVYIFIMTFRHIHSWMTTESVGRTSKRRMATQWHEKNLRFSSRWFGIQVSVFTLQHLSIMIKSLHYLRLQVLIYKVRIMMSTSKDAVRIKWRTISNVMYILKVEGSQQVFPGSKTWNIAHGVVFQMAETLLVAN